MGKLAAEIRQSCQSRLGRGLNPLVRPDRGAYTADMPTTEKNIIKKRVHRRLMAILAASSWNGGTVEQEIETRLPDLGKLFTREEALKEMEDRSIYSSL